MYAADVVDLYYITNSNELYVIYSPNATNQNQKRLNYLQVNLLLSF